MTSSHTSTTRAELRETKMPSLKQLDLNKRTTNLFSLRSIMQRQCCPPFLPHLPCLGLTLLPYLRQAVLTFSRHTHEVTQRLSGQVHCLSTLLTRTEGWGHLPRSELEGQLYLCRSPTDTIRLFAPGCASASQGPHSFQGNRLRGRAKTGSFLENLL